MKVLVIEDREDVADMLCHALRRKGYECDCETEPERGLEKALAGDYDLITLDLMMPHLNGFTIAERVRKAGVRTPILLVTGRTDDPLLKGSARRAGIDRILVKPVDLDQLYECVGCLTGDFRAGCAEARGG